MPSKIKQVFGAVKDQTSISLALVSLRGSSTNIELAVLKATSHDETPINDRYATEVLLLASSSPVTAADTAIALKRRIRKTSSWIVALKTLTLIYTTIVDAGPDFRREAAMRKLLDLSSFRSAPWDFTAFVRTYALYLDARLQSSLQGYISLRRRRRRTTGELKPGVVLDRIQHWMRLVDRAIGTRPTGKAKTNRLVQISLWTVARESFDVYRDISQGISLLLDNFFQLPYQSCVATVEVCTTCGKLFEDLDEFYAVCKEIGVGREKEYPTVQKISKNLLHRLNKHLRENQGSTVEKSDSPQKELLGETDFGKRQGTSFDGDERKKVDNESSLPMLKVARSTNNKDTSDIVTYNPLLDDTMEQKEEEDIEAKRIKDTGKSDARKSSRAPKEEGRGQENSSFAESAWIQKLDESARQQLIREKQLWMQHQNKMVERNLAFL